MSNNFKDSVCALTAICQDDAVWISQYLAEITRIGVPFVCLLDRMRGESSLSLESHPLCAGIVKRSVIHGEFNEMAKQPAMDLLHTLGFGWAVAWDVDETWEREAPDKFEELFLSVQDADHVQVTWMNLWGSTRQIRVDGPFQPSPRVKMYNLKEAVWTYNNPIVNGPKSNFLNGRKAGPGDSGLVLKRMDVVCLHHGMMTGSLREEHRLRWDRIYGSTDYGCNPYEFWNYACNTSITPVVVKHGYF